MFHLWKRNIWWDVCFYRVRSVVNARYRDRWKDEQMRGDGSECWLEPPPLTSLNSVSNSNLFWEAAVIFTFSFLILDFNLIYFIHGPEGNIVSTLCLWAEPVRAMLLEQVAVRYPVQGCFGRYWCAGVQTTGTAEQKSKPLDHIDLMCSQNNEVWQLTYCKMYHWRVMEGEDDL